MPRLDRPQHERQPGRGGKRALIIAVERAARKLPDQLLIAARHIEVVAAPATPVQSTLGNEVVTLSWEASEREQSQPRESQFTTSRPSGRAPSSLAQRRSNPMNAEMTQQDEHDSTPIYRRERYSREQRLQEDDRRPVITCESAFWGTAYPHLLWPNGAEEDPVHAAALAAVA